MPNWIVRMRCTVIKEVCVEDCSAEQARTSPWEHTTAASDEREIEQEDWEVLSIEENK